MSKKAKKTALNPIENIVWIDANELKANGYNPNHVLSKEMELLKLSIIKNGWIQPVLISQDKTIIDGFHRSTIARLNGWKVPCCVLEISEAERMLLTIRINRAKGTHIAFKMADIMKKLINEYGLSSEYIANEIGANIDEVNLLLMEDVFDKLDIKNHQFSTAWEVKK